MMNEPTSKILLSSSVNVLEFCPFEAAGSLIAYATANSLHIQSVKLNASQNDSTEVTTSPEFEFNLNQEEISCLSWSAQSNIRFLPRCAKIAFGTDSGQVCVVTTDFEDGNSNLALEGHKKCVNSVAFNPVEDTHILASCSDDHTCKLWDTYNKVVLAVLPLQYAGVDLSWNVLSINMLMVAELSGSVRLYKLLKDEETVEVKVTRTLKCNKGALIAADWCQVDSNRIGAAVENQFVIWDISKSCFSDEKRQCHTGGATNFRWSRFNADVFLTQGRPKHGTKVHRFGHRETIYQDIKNVGSGVTWHCSLPLLAVAGNHCIEFKDLTSQTET